MAQFPKFKDLPQELQDLIWDHAIRDDRPAAHFLSIFKDSRKDTDPEGDGTLIAESQRVQVLDRTDPPQYDLGAPRAFSETHRSRHSWTENNASIYMEDSGLWTACFASRQRMLNFFQPQTTSTRVTAEARNNDKPVTAHMGFRRENGEQQYLTIRPSMDLLCLQIPRNERSPFDLSSGLEPGDEGYVQYPVDEGDEDSSFVWKRASLAWEALLDQFPPFTMLQAATLDMSRSTRFSALQDIALEFDPRWNEDDEEWILALMTSTADHLILENLKSVWFIDYQLKRRTTPVSLPTDESRYVSHGRGCEFVEVGPWEGDQWSHWTPGEADEVRTRDDPLWPDLRIHGTAHRMARDLEFMDDADSHVFYGVLACVKIGHDQGGSPQHHETDSKLEKDVESL